jgi:hypothetical protein
MATPTSAEILVDVTLGSNTGFSLTTTVSGETFFGSSDGSVTTAIAGGTGPFTYVWSNNETTSGIANLSGGDYSVVVTDLSNGCLNKDTVTVAEGPKFTVHVGNVQGCQGETITVPVTVDNFIAVSGLSLGLMLDNADRRYDNRPFKRQSCADRPGSGYEFHLLDQCQSFCRYHIAKWHAVVQPEYSARKCCGGYHQRY